MIKHPLEVSNILVIEGESHSMKMGGWSFISEFECNLMKMKESEGAFLKNCHKTVLLHWS